MFSYKLLHDRMIKNSMGTEKLAEVMGMEVDEVKELLNGGKGIPMEQLGMLCEYFHCQVSDMVTWVYGHEDYVKLNWDKIPVPLTSFALKCGLSRSALVNAKNGNGVIKFTTAVKIADVLGCDVKSISAKKDK